MIAWVYDKAFPWFCLTAVILKPSIRRNGSKENVSKTRQVMDSSFQKPHQTAYQKSPCSFPQGLRDNAGIGLLSHVKMRSIMGDEALNFRVRNGIGCTRFSMDTKEIFQNI